jgi:hypothetical protein
VLVVVVHLHLLVLLLLLQATQCYNAAVAAATSVAGSAYPPMWVPGVMMLACLQCA